MAKLLDKWFDFNGGMRLHDGRLPDAGQNRKKGFGRMQYAAPALETGLDILELLAREPEPINQKEIAERLKRSAGEISRMFAVLEQRGYMSHRQAISNAVVI